MSPSPVTESEKQSPLASTPSSPPPPPPPPPPPSPPSGLIRLLPPALVPFAQLIRLDKPGFVHFLVPLLTGALLSADIRQTPPRELTSTLLTLSVFSLPLTFLNFSWNDTLDVSLDRRVRRTRDRPIARGAITIPQARVINLVLLGLCVAALWPASEETWIVGLIAGAGAAIYPFTKRWTMFPQLVFALVMAMGVLIGASADGSTPFFECGSFRECRWKRLDRATESTLWFYFANVAWNVGYEIVYSFQDVEDDERAGSGSIAVVIKKRPMPLLWMLAAMQTVCFACAGVVARAGSAYFILSVGVSGVSIVAKLWSVDLRDPESCIWWFSRGVMLAGGSITLGLFIDYLTQVV